MFLCVKCGVGEGDSPQRTQRAQSEEMVCAGCDGGQVRSGGGCGTLSVDLAVGGQQWDLFDLLSVFSFWQS